MQQDKRLDGWCLFIDLLGVRYLSVADPDTLFRQFSDFFEQLENVGSLYGKCKIYPLSDSAFVYSDDLASLIGLVQNLRPPLFSEGVFFKGGICAGSAELKWPSERRQVFGVSFTGKGPSEAYSAQAALNSVGVNVIRPSSKEFQNKAAEFDEAEANSKIFQSGYIDSSPQRNIFPYYEVALTRNEIGYNFSYRENRNSDSEFSQQTTEGFNAIETLLKSFRYTKHLDHRTSVKFISLLLSIALCSDLSRANYNKKNRVWENVTPLFVKFFIESDTKKILSDTIFNPVYTFMAVKIISQIDHNLTIKLKSEDKKSSDDAIKQANQNERIARLASDETVSFILKTIFARKGLIESVGRYPSRLISKKDADTLFRLFGHGTHIHKT